ncbi:AAA family ATPase [Desulfococcaceae bacterium HSG8]|nr:AAA family ATPase [Desulfococcaceae bacterium HSG8]
MEIRQLRLENIGCFKDQQFDFSNLTVVHGENRAGKSTLVYAIFFALFGIHLHKSLRLEDLCRKGEKFGTLTLYLNTDHMECYKLRRSTVGMPGIYAKSEDMTWQPLSSDSLTDWKSYIPVSSEVASLSSFFREGELIYFLQDIPKYNKTLLQSLIGIDDVAILQSRLKKTLAMAREALKITRKAIPEKPVTYNILEESRKKVAELEKEFQIVEKKYKSISADPGILRFLKKLHEQCEEKKKRLENALKLKKEMPLAEKLGKEKAEAEKYLKCKDAVLKRESECHRRIGAHEQKEKDLKLRIERLSDLEKQAVCPACEQILSSEHLSGLIPRLKKQMLEAIQDQLKSKEELNNIEEELKKIRALEKRVSSIDRDIYEIRRLDENIRQLQAQAAESERELNQYKHAHPEIVDIGKHASRKKELETERSRVQKQMIEDKARIRQYENELKHAEKRKRETEIAEKRVVICDVAHRALDTAVREVGSGLLHRVRKSIRAWTEHFTFLNQFDIEITNRELLPIIQAKGYQYKLNQMSKSERIFLYLMLKLAIGDALGHLGIFILDDPADGLDLKRKQTLAYLLVEIARKRQVIVTTNDASFAGLFSESSRVDL